MAEKVAPGSSMFVGKSWEAKFNRLREAVRAIYYAAVWRPDREVADEGMMWLELRDAAGFEPGQSPKPL